MSYNHKKCEDEDDATRMAEVILRNLGYTDVQKGSNKYSVDDKLPTRDLFDIARYAERIGRWARSELKHRGV